MSEREDGDDDDDDDDYRNSPPEAHTQTHAQTDRRVSQLSSAGSGSDGVGYGTSVSSRAQSKEVKGNGKLVRECVLCARL